MEEISISRYFLDQLDSLRKILDSKVPEVVTGSFGIIQTKVLNQLNNKYETVGKLFMKVVNNNSLTEKDVEAYKG